MDSRRVDKDENGLRHPVSDAVRRRRSVRAFLSDPVAEGTIRGILDDARWSPSGGNVQPWRIDVVAGDALDALRAIMVERAASGAIETPHYDVYPANLWEPHRSYRYELGEAMYGLLGLNRDDKAGRQRQLNANFRFFGAPVGLFFSTQRRFGSPQWADLGIMMQTIMLLAVERGLGSCAQEAWSFWPETVGAFLGLAEEDILFAGMAIGYPDPSAAVNQLRTGRAELDAFVTFHGFPASVGSNPR
jgi:nitroreductase